MGNILSAQLILREIQLVEVHVQSHLTSILKLDLKTYMYIVHIIFRVGCFICSSLMAVLFQSITI